MYIYLAKNFLSEDKLLKQFNYEIKDTPCISETLDSIYNDLQFTSYKSILFHLYTIKFTIDEIKKIQNEINEVFPKAFICGTSTNGDICDGHLAEYGMVMAVSIFESTDIDVRLFECELGQETSAGIDICTYLNGSSKIKAAEIFITLKSINSHRILSEIEKCNHDIDIFGGGSAGEIISSDDTKVFDKNMVTKNGVIVVTYSGDDFYIDVHHAIGWKPLGKELTVTKIDGKRLYEINNTPASEVYSKYLDIQADDDFFSNILEFPIMTYQHGQPVLRLPFECYKEDGSIFLAADIDIGAPINLSYGDPDVIKGDVNELVKTVESFAPQAIFLYSCGVRRLYWKYLINKETVPFSNIAPVSGFYSSGEIMKIDDYIIEHHVTLIAISMREGGKAKAQPTGNIEKNIPMTDEQKIHSQISMVRCLANFINVTSAELEEANKKLQVIADTDELTGLYNRRLLDQLLKNAVDSANKFNLDMVVGIVDIDDFKEVNDTFGHAAGDKVLREITTALNKELHRMPGGVLGRWGGEEFLFIAPQFKLDDIYDNFEAARKRVSSINIEGIGVKTISLGITAFISGDTPSTIFARADAALYEAKKTGKNRTCRK